MFSATSKSLNSLILFSLLFLFVSPRTLAQTAATTGTTVTDDDDDAGEVDCEYEGSVKNYLTCAKNKISTPMLIGAGIGITLGVFLLSFLCIWLTKKKRRRAAAQKDQYQDQIDQQIVNVNIDDLEKNPHPDPAKEFFYPDDTKIPLPETKPINPSNDDKSRSFELLAPPMPKPKHSRSPSNASSISNSSSSSTKPTILENASTSLKPRPSLRKGSRDELYANPQRQPLKHAPSTRRPNPTFHKHMNQASINGSIHGAPGPGSTRESQVHVQVSDRSGSPVQMVGKRELEITNPNPQSNPPSRQSSLHLNKDKDKDRRPSSTTAHPQLPDTAHQRPGESSNRRSITHLPKPTTRSSVPPPPYALGPQPPAPSAQHGTGQHSAKPQMPLRGASQMTLPLPPLLEDSRVSASPSVSSRQTTLALPKETDDGRSGTFGPDLGVAEGMKREILGGFASEKEKEKGASGDEGDDSQKKGEEKKEQVDMSRTEAKEAPKPALDAGNENEKEKRKEIVPFVTATSETTSTKTPSDTVQPEVEKKPEGEGEPQQETKTKTKTRREELRQTNLIPSYYVNSHGVSFADDEKEELPHSERSAEEEVGEQKQKQAEEPQAESTKEAKGDLQGEEGELPNPFDERSEQPKEKSTKEKKDKKSKHKKSKKSEEKKE